MITLRSRVSAARAPLAWVRFARSAATVACCVAAGACASSRGFPSCGQFPDGTRATFCETGIDSGAVRLVEELVRREGRGDRFTRPGSAWFDNHVIQLHPEPGYDIAEVILDYTIRGRLQ